MVGDVHRTLLYGGIFGYPGDINNPNGGLIVDLSWVDSRTFQGVFRRPCIRTLRCGWSFRVLVNFFAGGRLGSARKSGPPHSRGFVEGCDRVVLRMCLALGWGGLALCAGSKIVGMYTSWWWWRLFCLLMCLHLLSLAPHSPACPGKLRLLYEGAPMAFICEQVRSRVVYLPCAFLPTLRL